MIDLLIKDLDKEMTEAKVTEQDSQADYEVHRSTGDPTGVSTGVSTEVPRKPWILDKITCLLSFSSKNHAESSRNFVKYLILNPKRTKLNQKS